VILGQLMLSILIATFAVIAQVLYVITGLKVEVDSYSCAEYGSNCDEFEQDRTTEQP